MVVEKFDKMKLTCEALANRNGYVSLVFACLIQIRLTKMIVEFTRMFGLLGVEDSLKVLMFGMMVQ